MAGGSSDDEEEKKEEEEKKTEEVTDEEAKSMDAMSATTAETKEEENKKLVSEGEKMVNKLKKPGKTINLEDIEEGDLGESHAQAGERQLLKGFTMPKVKIHLLADTDISTLGTKRKYQGLFDIGVMSVHSADKINP